jgi:hypothetical protein
MNYDYHNFFYNTEYLESVYNMLKGDEKELSREHIKKLIENFEEVEYESESIKDSCNETEITSTSENVSFEEFCSIFQKIYENSQSPKQIFIEGFSFLDLKK